MPAGRLFTSFKMLFSNHLRIINSFVCVVVFFIKDIFKTKFKKLQIRNMEWYVSHDKVILQVQCLDQQHQSHLRNC